ncbi:ABC transporter ATP-binding protein [Dolosigranulum pigrum]|uniref:ABC transporter ATP-binding protein n=1 Tax=Dolosigranulum pigrum TaxID=29394 RepID=UPI001AD8573A|nr:ABC transporter ATP-binding protein [Dolosigranulum pigrum]
MSNPAVSLEKVKKQFKNKYALKDINMSVEKGEIFGLLGPSGAGKTTTIKIITKKETHDYGRVTIFGKKINDVGQDLLSRFGIVSDDSGYYKRLDLITNLKIHAKLYDRSDSYVENLLKKMGLFEDRKTKAKNLSVGMRQRMFLARALIKEPVILFLDEPTSGLDPQTSNVIHQLILDLKQNGTTVFLTTHDMKEAEKLCDTIGLLHEGKIIEKDTPQRIINKFATESDNDMKVIFKNGDVKFMNTNSSEFESINNDDVMDMYRIELTLEDVFLKLTGDELDV